MPEAKPRRLESAEVVKKNADGSVRFILTRKEVDRYGDVVMPEGIDVKEFKSNPIVLFGHGGGSNQGNIPIGKIMMETLRISKTQVEADIMFDEESGDEFAEMIAKKVRAGFLNAGSIGFRPIEISNDPVLPKQTGVTFNKWKLLEFSVVPIPALPSALAKRDFVELRDCFEKQYGADDISRFDDMIEESYVARGYTARTQEEDTEPELKTLLKSVQAELGVVKSILESMIAPPEEDPAEVETEIPAEKSDDIDKDVTEVKDAMTGLLNSLKETKTQLEGGRNA